jgi:hypothetical protein
MDKRLAQIEEDAKNHPANRYRGPPTTFANMPTLFEPINQQNGGYEAGSRTTSSTRGARERKLEPAGVPINRRAGMMISVQPTSRDERNLLAPPDG